MRQTSCKRHRFPPEVIRQAVWLYYRFTLSFRDVEELLAARGIDVSYETVRCWAEKFGLAIARPLQRREFSHQRFPTADRVNLTTPSPYLARHSAPWQSVAPSDLVISKS